MLLLPAVLTLALASQSPATDRSTAESLGRAGQTDEAIAIFQEIVERNPADVDPRLWIARLQLRRGNTEEAEAGFRLVLHEHPSDVDARIGLASVLTRKGAWPQAIEMLVDAERDAGDNSDLYGALARGYRRAGDPRRAPEYFKRAMALAPADADLVSAYKATAHAYGHSIVFEGFGEQSSSNSQTGSGSVMLTVRAAERLHLEVGGRVQQRSGSAEAVAGGGIRWRAGSATTIVANAVGGAGNQALPSADISAAFVQY